MSEAINTSMTQLEDTNANNSEIPSGGKDVNSNDGISGLQNLEALSHQVEERGMRDIAFIDGDIQENPVSDCVNLVAIRAVFNDNEKNVVAVDGDVLEDAVQKPETYVSSSFDTSTDICDESLVSDVPSNDTEHCKSPSDGRATDLGYSDSGIFSSASNDLSMIQQSSEVNACGCPGDCSCSFQSPSDAAVHDNSDVIDGRDASNLGCCGQSLESSPCSENEDKDLAGRPPSIINEDGQIEIPKGQATPTGDRVKLLEAVVGLENGPLSEDCVRDGGVSDCPEATTKEIGDSSIGLRSALCGETPLAHDSVTSKSVAGRCESYETYEKLVNGVTRQPSASEESDDHNPSSLESVNLSDSEVARDTRVLSEDDGLENDTDHEPSSDFVVCPTSEEMDVHQENVACDDANVLLSDVQTAADVVVKDAVQTYSDANILKTETESEDLRSPLVSTENPLELSGRQTEAASVVPSGSQDGTVPLIEIDEKLIGSANADDVTSFSSLKVPDSEQASNCDLVFKEGSEEDVLKEGEKNVSGDVTEDLLEDVLEDVREDLLEDILEDVRKDLVKDVKEDLLEDVKEDLSEDVKEDLSEDVKEDPLEDFEDGFLEGIRKDFSGSVEEDLLEDGKEGPLDDGEEGLLDSVEEDLLHKVADVFVKQLSDADRGEVIYDVPSEEDAGICTLVGPSEKQETGLVSNEGTGGRNSDDGQENIFHSEKSVCDTLKSDRGGSLKEENYYEEIKRERLDFQGHGSSGGGGGVHEIDKDVEGQSLFRRCGLVEEVMSEVERVKQRHDQVLQELNLDIEQLIMPVIPSVSPPDDSDCQCEPLPALHPPTSDVPPPAGHESSARDHNLSTRTLPPLPVESSPEESLPLRSSSTARKTRSVPLGCPNSVPPTTSPTGVKQWLSRLPSLSSFREKKPRPNSTPSEVISWRWSLDLPEEPIYMLYDDTYHLHAGPKNGPEDGIYEDLDASGQRFTMPSSGTYASLSKNNFADGQSLSSSECVEDNSDAESTRSSGSLSVASFKGKLLNFGRKLSRHDEKKDAKAKIPMNDGKSDGKLIRLFSRRKGYDLGRVKKKNAIAETPEEQKLPQLQMSSHTQRPILPPTPTGLTPEQTKRRYIVGTLVQNENSYVSSLKRLLIDYKKILEESSPPIISASKIAVMFHRLPEILQCHTEFCISLSTCIKFWDKSESIGEVFLHAFSKTVVLDIYSDYINNFSDAMELAKAEAKRKGAFSDFLKARQITSHDRLSFFGLMVKPVQRFPQFILILQDLLKHTPQRHNDRMKLQLALTQMETMADMLNERKRESDQAHAVKGILRHVSAKSAAKSLAEGSRFLLREDTLSQLIFNQNGQWMKSKDRKLFLLNDLLVCVSVVGHSSTENNRKSERFSFKWAVSLTEVEVQEDASPILNRMVQAMSTGQSSATKANTNGPVEMEGVKSIYQDLNDLLHDFEVTSRITALVSTLKRSYLEISVEQMQSLSQSIQQAIQKKDEEVKWIDSCCLQFSIPLKKTGKGNRELLIFQLKSMDTKQEWLTDIRLAQLALDVNNSPAWDLPEQERRPSTKIPLFVKAVPIHSSRVPTEVKCGCYHHTMSTRLLCRRPQNYVWLCSTDGINSHLSVHTLRQMGLHEVFNFDMTECRISSMESVPSVDCPSGEISLQGDTVWLGTESRRVLVYSGVDSEHFKEVGCAMMSASVLHLKYHMNQVFVALANGTLAVFHRNNRGYWQMKDFQIITLGNEPVTCLLPINASVYCGCGRKVWVIDSTTAKVTLNQCVQHDHMGSVYTMAHSGIGLWLNLRNTPLICLYHAETFQHLQDINITSCVRRILNETNRPHTPRYCCVTVLTASWGLLWIGTNVGVVLSIPLPRLQGMPILGRRANVAYHSVVGPVAMILVLQPLSMLTSPRTKTEADKRNRDNRNSVAKSLSENSFQSVNVPPHALQHLKSFRLATRGDSMTNLGAAKTLPRSFKSHLTNSDSENCIFGLYDNLLNVREGVEDPVSQIDDELRHSDPDLIPSLASTLDRRVRLKSGRPRSLDLANLAGMGDVTCISSSSEDGGSGSQSLVELPEYAHAIHPQIKECDGEEHLHGDVADVTSLEMDEIPAVGKDLKLSNVTRLKKTQGVNTQLSQRSVVTLVGGRGYADLRKPPNRRDKRSSASYPYCPSDAYAVMWEMKV